MTAASAALGLIAGSLLAIPVAYYADSAEVGYAAAAAAVIGVGMILTNSRALSRYFARR